MVTEKQKHNEHLAREIRSSLGYNRITITQLAKEIGKTRVTISLWLIEKTTQERYDAMKAAIGRILERGGK